VTRGRVWTNLGGDYWDGEILAVPSCPACLTSLPLRPSRAGAIVVACLCSGCGRFVSYGPGDDGRRPEGVWASHGAALDDRGDPIQSVVRHWDVRHRLNRLTPETPDDPRTRRL
jgi:hypothetical protein